MDAWTARLPVSAPTSGSATRARDQLAELHRQNALVPTTVAAWNRSPISVQRCRLLVKPTRLHESLLTIARLPQLLRCSLCAICRQPRAPAAARSRRVGARRRNGPAGRARLKPHRGRSPPRWTRPSPPRPGRRAAASASGQSHALRQRARLVATCERSWSSSSASAPFHFIQGQCLRLAFRAVRENRLAHLHHHGRLKSRPSDQAPAPARHAIAAASACRASASGERPIPLRIRLPARRSARQSAEVFAAAPGAA